MNILHAIHDFPPRHRAGSEIYALGLARAQSARHHVTVLCADYNPALEHGHVAWRVHEGVPVVEIINNWTCSSFADTYRPPLIGDRIRHVLRTIRPDVVHVHNLLNLSFDLPAMARAMGIPIVATLHDYTLVCASGGQRVHRSARHVCHDIDTARCARCFPESPFYAQSAFGRVTATGPGARVVRRAAVLARRLWPTMASRAATAARHLGTFAVTPSEIDARLDAARRVFMDVDRFIAPSAAIGEEFTRLGMPRDRIRVSDYGMPPLTTEPRRAPRTPLRLGFVGTLVWHKGVHVLVEAVRALPRDACTLKIFGNPETFPDYTATLRKQAAGLPIEFMGGFDPSRAAEAYASIDVLVVPSLWPENSPLVIHEAFMAGVPVVGARSGGIPGLVTDGVNGVLYEPSSADDLARALRLLAEDPGRIAALAAHAPAVKTLPQDAAEWEAVYLDVTQPRPVAPTP